MHFQYNYSFYAPRILANFIENNYTKLEIFITLHSVLPIIKNVTKEFNLAKKIFVHSEKDRNELIKFGLNNVEIIEHGLTSFLDESKSSVRKGLNIQNSKVIASHGLIHEKKGLLETLEAVALLKEKYTDVLYLAINAVNTNNSTSQGVFDQMKQFIKEKHLENNVILISKFLSSTEVNTLLHASDIVVLAYSELNEGASGAVRTAIGAKRPIVITKSSIFNSLNIGYRIDNNKPETIANAISYLYKNQDILEKERAKVIEYNENHNWNIVKISHFLSLL